MEWLTVAMNSLANGLVEDSTSFFDCVLSVMMQRHGSNKTGPILISKRHIQ